MRCAAHKAETLLRCGKCEAPICPDCTVMGPVGARCRACAALRTGALYQVGVDRLALGIVAGSITATLIGYLLAAASEIGFFLIWGGVLGGGAIGEVILRVTGRKRGPKIEISTGLCAVLGMILGFLLWCVVASHPIALSSLLVFLPHHPFFLVGVCAAVFSAVSRVRFW